MLWIHCISFVKTWYPSNIKTDHNSPCFRKLEPFLGFDLGLNSIWLWMQTIHAGTFSCSVRQVAPHSSFWPTVANASGFHQFSSSAWELSINASQTIAFHRPSILMVFGVAPCQVGQNLLKNLKIRVATDHQFLWLFDLSSSLV